MSGLPSGYTQLEYIQSTGTQYINTGFVPSPDTRAVIDAQITAQTAASAAYLGERSGSGGTDKTAYELWSMRTGANISSDFFGNRVSKTMSTIGTRVLIDKNKASVTINGSTITNSAAAGTATLPIFLLASNDKGTAAFGIAAKLYACQLYDNGALVRDFVPCKNASGAVGLYDTVGAQFYANAGTGTFTAGPEVVYEPDAPTNFAASVSGQTVALSWAASANAAGYRLKRDGVQIAEQTGTTYTDTVPDGTTLCTYALTAYNDAGESSAAALTVILRLDLITDRTRADVENETDKGFYNASDLNRVGAAAEYIAGRFAALGYACPVTVKKDWLTSDAPTASQLETYRQNIVTLRSRIAVMQSTPEAPASMAGLNYVKANNIEMILLTLNFILNHIPAAVRHCGVTVCGGKGVRA